MAGAIDQNQRATGANQVAKLAIEGFGGAAFVGLTYGMGLGRIPFYTGLTALAFQDGEIGRIGGRGAERDFMLGNLAIASFGVWASYCLDIPEKNDEIFAAFKEQKDIFPLGATLAILATSVVLAIGAGGARSVLKYNEMYDTSLERIQILKAFDGSISLTSAFNGAAPMALVITSLFIAHAYKGELGVGIGGFILGIGVILGFGSVPQVGNFPHLFGQGDTLPFAIWKGITLLGIALSKLDSIETGFKAGCLSGGMMTAAKYFTDRVVQASLASPAGIRPQREISEVSKMSIATLGAGLPLALLRGLDWI